MIAHPILALQRGDCGWFDLELLEYRLLFGCSGAQAGQGLLGQPHAVPLDALEVMQRAADAELGVVLAQPQPQPQAHDPVQQGHEAHRAVRPGAPGQPVVDRRDLDIALARPKPRSISASAL